MIQPAVHKVKMQKMQCVSSLKITKLNIVTPANAALEVISETRAWQVQNVSTKSTITRRRQTHIAVKAI